MLFEKFGEFDSAEELNRAAAAQLAEGDIDAIYGIPGQMSIDQMGKETEEDRKDEEESEKEADAAAGIYSERPESDT